jgi:hypothetical protein
MAWPRYLSACSNLPASEKASTNANRVEALLDFTLQCRTPAVALGQVGVKLGGMIQVVRNDLVDVGQCCPRKFLRNFLSRRASPER